MLFFYAEGIATIKFDGTATFLKMVYSINDLIEN